MTVEQLNSALSKAVKSALLRLPAAVGNEAVNFALDNFEKQSWAGESWPTRKNPTKWGKVCRPGRALLIDTAALKRSIRITRMDGDKVYIGSAIPYAKAHNEGFEGAVVQNIKAYSRTQYGITKVSSLKTKKTFSRKVSIGQIPVKAHTRTVHQKIPKRQFMGHHPALTERLVSTVEAVILQELNFLNS